MLVILAIAFGTTMDTHNNVAAVLEWVIAFGFTFYLLTFFFDLRAVRNVTDEEIHQNLWNSRRMNGARRY